MSILDLNELERLRYWKGQMLRSRDFRDQVAIEAQLRWWHNRALHNTFGVIDGFRVDLEGNNNAYFVTVHPGLAYDCFGREIILLSPQRLPIPEISQDGDTKTLLTRHKSNTCFPRKGDIHEVCYEDSGSVTMEQPEFFWKASWQVTFRDGVSLARIVYKKGKVEKDKNFNVIYSRPLARPHIASGSTISGNTAWEVWDTNGQGNNPIQIGFKVRVDTSAAGLTEVPCYFAWLEGQFWNQSDNQFFIAPFDHIDEPSMHGFVFRLWMPKLPVLRKKANEDFEDRFLAFAQEKGLFVSWIGVQPWPDHKSQKE